MNAFIAKRDSFLCLFFIISKHKKETYLSRVLTQNIHFKKKRKLMFLL